ncbi:MAG: rotamase [Phenylobacterium sp.]|nr:MAG: rotamase [Phenylobacterium sp.]
MLAAFRAFAKSWVAAVLMGVLIFAFAVWGIRKDVFTGHVSDSVISAGSRTVTSAQFKHEFDSQKTRFEQQVGQPIPTEMAVANGLDRQVLEGMANQEAFYELLRKMGVQPSDKLEVAEIQKIPAFFDQVSGRFDKAAYQQRLQENGLSVPVFEQMIHDDIAAQHLVIGIAGGLVVPRAYTAMAAVYGLENRDVALMVVGPQSVPPPAMPTDAQLNGFLKDNAAQLLRPEFRALSLVRFSPEAVAVAATPIDPAELQKRYNFRKDTLSKPETRTLDQVPAKDQATAVQIAARLAKGESPSAVAKAFGVEAISYADKPQSAIPDHKLAVAAFQLKSGQTAPVQGDLGLAVVRVDAVTPGHVVTLEEIRPALEAEIRKDAASSKIDAMTQAYDDAHAKGATLPEAAQKAGVAVIVIPPVAKQGLDQQGKPVAGLSQKIMDTAFSLPAGGESELVDAGNGEYFALRVDKVIAPAIPQLADIKPQLTREWLRRDLLTRLKAKAEELAARVKKGESLEAVAASAGLKVIPISGLNRQTASQNQAISQEILAGAFNGKPGDVFTATDPRVGFVVGKIQAIRPGDPAMLARAAEETRGQMSTAYVREMQSGAEGAARREIKVKIDPERARTALGLEPATPGKPAGKSSDLAK